DDVTADDVTADDVTTKVVPGSDWDEAEERLKLAEVIRQHGLVPVNNDLEVSHVTAMLCIGSRYVAKDLATLEAHGVKAIVNLTPDVPNYFADKFEYLRLSVEDSPSIDLRRELPALCEFVDAQLRRGSRVLLHCHAGISRAPSFTVAYLTAGRGMNLADACALLLRSRSHVNLTNFESQLALLERERLLDSAGRGGLDE
ncbi:hypothetical protein BOX15_Mlig025010g2, partial [Macrostomum lignano]